MAAAKEPPFTTSPRPLHHRRYPSSLCSVDEERPIMSNPIEIPKKSRSLPEPSLDLPDPVSSTDDVTPGTSLSTAEGFNNDSFTNSSTHTPRLSRNPSFAGSAFRDEDDEQFLPPVDRLTVFDFIENLDLPLRLEKLQSTISAQTEKVRRSQQRLKSTGMIAKDRMVDEWRRRMPTNDEQLDKYRRRMRDSVDRLNKRWSEKKAVTLREKISFIAGVLNIFISGYMVGAFPQYFHYWYTAQLVYYMPIRYYTYHKKGYHYFLADLCYFVNLLVFLSIWIFPNSKRLFISTYCLAFGNNAVAIAMWRNSLVFHSLDKVVSLFIHIMPCVTLHCIVHLLPASVQRERFPAIHTIRFSEATSPEHYTLFDMMFWATVPYLIWQLTYHLLITVRRREKIAAGRPTSFTWLRKSYAPTWIGKFVLSLPDPLQEPAFMCIQYGYALLTMIPCPLWFWNRWASAGFLIAVFTWSIYNGAKYYIDIFGKRFEKELDQLKRDVAKWQVTPDGKDTPLLAPKSDSALADAADRQDDSGPKVEQKVDGGIAELIASDRKRQQGPQHNQLAGEEDVPTASVSSFAGSSAVAHDDDGLVMRRGGGDADGDTERRNRRKDSIDRIPLLDEKAGAKTR